VAAWSATTAGAMGPFAQVIESLDPAGEEVVQRFSPASA
jgi:hypothetical protein